ncbi:hypothetical protein AAE478_005643 [Parahypoxylon ruwenzoriense]
MGRPRQAVRSNPPRAAKSKKPTRETRSTAAYFDLLADASGNDIDDDLNDDFDDDDNSDVIDHPARHTRSATRKRKARHDNYSPPKGKIPRRARDVAEEAPSNISNPGTSNSAEPTPVAPHTPSLCPPWHTLPYHVLLRTFDFLAAPIRDDSSRGEDISEAVVSLMSAARVCKAFAEPALAGLYKCPPFHRRWTYIKAPNCSFMQFIRTLTFGETAINYRPKVKIIRLDVDSILSKKWNGIRMHSWDILRALPNLSHLELYHPCDEPPYRRLDENFRPIYSVSWLIRTVAQMPDIGRPEGGGDPLLTPLRSWRWNSRLTSPDLRLDELEQTHLGPNFRDLRKVAFVNYQLASWGLPRRVQFTEEVQQASRGRIAQLSACISALPNLEHLVLESCTLANGTLLGLLPTTLKHLELVNCWEVTAKDLGDFLVTRGNSLEMLTLNHCQSLSLGFLPVLGSACPNLLHFYMDLSYFRHHEHYADNKPEYDQLLVEGEVPTWPSSMQSIEILHMRKWGRKAAETFFESLLQSAPSLPHLRRLAFRIALDISWRQRRELREFWVDRMVRVFKKRAKPPSNFRTLRQPQLGTRREHRTVSQEDQETKCRTLESAALPKRRSTRISSLTPTSTSSERETPYLTKSELTRMSAVGRELKGLRGSGLLLKEHHAEDEGSEDELVADHSDQSRPDRAVKKISKRSLGDNEFVHGLCDVVDIHVDNHRPMEKQYDMDDFLDSAQESDPDWDGGDVDIFD